LAFGGGRGVGTDKPDSDLMTNVREAVRKL
jgi:hypothetical protein